MIYLIDLFCGAGGVSTGASQADGVTVIGCVNHDANAIKSHAANHPNCIHYTEDIRTLDLTELAELVRSIRRRDPSAIIGLWASLECTNFSRAKGGLPRDADSRTLAEHLYRYIEQLDPDIIYIENVEEFMAWGPLDERGKPISKHRGCDFLRWMEHVKSYGYRYDHRILNAADYGAYTSRKRYFAQFAKPHMAIEWPEATHAKRTKLQKGLFDGLKPWRPVREVLQLDKHGQSIFGRSKNLSDKTYERIWHGLVKFVAGGKEAFILNYQHSSTANDTNEPSPTITTRDKYAFIAAYYGNGHNCHSTDGPAPTIRTKDGAAIIQPEQFIMRDFSGGGQTSDINKPAGSVLSTPKMNLVTPAFLMNPQYMNAGGSVDNPAFTLIARMDKMPPYLVVTEHGQVAITVQDTDSEHMVKIKEFMALYGIIDIKMRMLFVDELLRIQGFPEGYILQGTQAEKKKFIGNAVEVNQARVILQSSASANIPVLKRVA